MSRTVTALLKTHFGAEVQTLAVCLRITLTHQQPDIVSITQANPGVVETEYDHGYTTGQIVQLAEVEGMTQVTDKFYTVTVTDPTHYSIGVDTTAFTAHTANTGESRWTGGLTNTDKVIEFEGVTYQANSGFTPSDVDTASDLTVDDFEMQGAYSDKLGLTSADLFKGNLDYSELEMFIVNYNDLTMEAMILEFGHMGELKDTRGGYLGNFRSLSHLLAQDTMLVTSPMCPYQLGDERCLVNLLSFTVTGTVTAVTDRRIFTDAASTEADNWFNGGRGVWTRGDNIGLEFEVKEFVSDVFTMYSNMIFPIQIGDGYKVIAGCRKRFAEDCKTKFSNQVRFGGHPHLPGDKAIREFKTGGD